MHVREADLGLDPLDGRHASSAVVELPEAVELEGGRSHGIVCLPPFFRRNLYH